ncbi:ferritin family protein [Mesoaciditoga sp.]
MIKSVDEVLETAKKIEESSYNFYTNAQNFVSQPHLKEELKALAEQEVEHKKRIEEMINRGVDEVAKGLVIDKIQDMKLGDYLLPSKIDSKSNIQDILIAAIKREDMTHQFYQNLLKGARDEDLRKVLEFLSIEELKHKNKLQFLYDDLIYQEN